MTSLAIDFENRSQLWWDAARRLRHEAPRAIRLLLGPEPCVTVDTQEAKAAMAWCAALPGWSTTGVRARTPIIAC